MLASPRPLERVVATTIPEEEHCCKLIMSIHYVGVLEYCDGIYEDLKNADIIEEERLRWAEEPFSNFHAKAFLKAYRQHNESEHRKLEKTGVSLPPLPPEPPGLYDLSLEVVKESHPWDEVIKEAAVLSSRQQT